MKSFNKLVRNNIPNIIRSNKKECSFEVLSDDEYKKCLLGKLLEEVDEFTEDPCIEELADILEVLDALVNANKFSWEEILHVKSLKKRNRGGFEKKIFLKSVSS